MDCFFCSADGSRGVAIGVCVDCGCGACGHHGAVENVRRSARTGNMFEERPVEVRRFACAACRALGASQHVKQGGTEAMVNEPAAPDPR
jgi:hypothetical protein